jgi:glucosamine--fructose-6-phosphate aminotransferase (isomerizing)
MCGIAGSSNKEKAFSLYQSNLDRGYYSSGSLVIDELRFCESKKVLGQFKIIPIAGNPSSTSNLYYLYHSRGPTTETLAFEEKDNHPFLYRDWVVAHNGIISNFEELKSEHFADEIFETSTDSSIIPRMLFKFGLKEGLSQLKGTFAVWAYNTITGDVYIARNSCTLYANLQTGDFSSTQFENSVMIKEGTVYKIVSFNKIIEETQFVSNSPYFIL